MSIGKQIATFRKQANLTQEKLGELVGVSNQSVSKWESDISSPDINLIPTIASALNVSIAELFECEKVNSDEQISIITKILPEIVEKAVNKATESYFSEIICEIRDIKCAVDDIQNAMEEIETAAEDASDNVSDAMDLIDELSEQVEELSEALEDISDMLDDVVSNNKDEDSPSTRKKPKVLLVVSPDKTTTTRFDGGYQLNHLGNGNWQIISIYNRGGGSVAQYPADKKELAEKAIKAMLDAYKQGKEILYL